MSTVDPETAQKFLTQAWLTPQQITWEIEWAAMPLSSPLTVETWRDGSRSRFEILEAPAPNLIGQIFVFDGEQGWQYNRFKPDTSLTSDVISLSPMSDAIQIVNQLLETPAQAASQSTDQINSEPARKTTLTFTNGDHLTMWTQLDTGLPLRLEFTVDDQRGILQARQATVLADEPPTLLFSVENWIENVK